MLNRLKWKERKGGKEAERERERESERLREIERARLKEKVLVTFVLLTKEQYSTLALGFISALFVKKFL